MVNHRSTLVAQVRDQLIELIATGSHAPGDRLPNEQEMSEHFDVSRATIREAYSSLVDMGYLIRRHGKGTFVARAPQRHALDRNMSYTALISAAGLQASIRVLSQKIEVADEADRARLRLDDDGLVLVVERIRYADERPVVYSIDRIPLALVPEAERDKVNPSLFSMFESLGHGARNGRARILPVLADDQMAAHLDVDSGTPLLLVEEVDYDEAGDPVLASTEWHRSDVFEMWINRRDQGALTTRR